MLAGAEAKLQDYFDQSLVRRFEYVRFAVDHDVENGMVMPGIGGDVYQRYGWQGAGDKNTFVPKLVTERRKLYAR